MKNKLMKLCGIYYIENLKNGKRYIGQSIDIYHRWEHHRSELNNGKHHNDYLQKAWNKYGENNFEFVILELCDYDVLDKKESFYINYYDTTNRDNGYNLKSGGQNGGTVFSDETRLKMKTSLKQYYENHPDRRERLREQTVLYWSNPENRKRCCGENNGMYGRTHSVEARQKISNSQRGRISPRRDKHNVRCIELNRIYIDAVSAAKDMGLSSSGILKVCRNERKTCGTFHWEFLETKEHLS